MWGYDGRGRCDKAEVRRVRLGKGRRKECIIEKGKGEIMEEAEGMAKGQVRAYEDVSREGVKNAEGVRER